ncbi:hypothetical protein HanIR_Chr05g0225121 [Helianthus annuus]|nr:hypothetical protein HanIR_Chr05g0225121 [Helianthus annuus]
MFIRHESTREPSKPWKQTSTATRSRTRHATSTFPKLTEPPTSTTTTTSKLTHSISTTLAGLVSSNLWGTRIPTHGA